VRRCYSCDEQGQQGWPAVSAAAKVARSDSPAPHPPAPFTWQSRTPGHHSPPLSPRLNSASSCQESQCRSCHRTSLLPLGLFLVNMQCQQHSRALDVCKSRRACFAHRRCSACCWHVLLVPAAAACCCCVQFAAARRRPSTPSGGTPAGSCQRAPGALGLAQPATTACLQPPARGTAAPAHCRGLPPG